MDFVIKRIPYLTNEVKFCETHFNWAMLNNRELYVLEKNGNKFSVAINKVNNLIEDSKLYSIMSYNQELTIPTGLGIIQMLENERLISSNHTAQKFHRHLLRELVETTVSSYLSCTCGAVKTFGDTATRQGFLHSDWCDLYNSKKQ
jgi:hypothetical protein